MKQKLREFFTFTPGERRMMIEFVILSVILIAILTLIVILLWTWYLGGGL